MTGKEAFWAIWYQLGRRVWAAVVLTAVIACAGDTGLLDHLLKHLADKVVTPEGDKLRRRHNAEGHMEYWLQSSTNAHAGKLRHL